jgi:hypothetical protein
VGLYPHSPKTPSWRRAQLKKKSTGTTLFLRVQLHWGNKYIHKAEVQAKDKVVLAPKHQAMTTYRGVEVKLHALLISALMKVVKFTLWPF